jgi:hypothetical protein
MFQLCREMYVPWPYVEALLKAYTGEQDTKAEGESRTTSNSPMCKTSTYLHKVVPVPSPYLNRLYRQNNLPLLPLLQREPRKYKRFDWMDVLGQLLKLLVGIGKLVQKRNFET